MTAKVKKGDWVYWDEGGSAETIGHLLAIDKGTGWFKGDDGAYLTVHLPDLTLVRKCPTCGEKA